MYLSLLEDGDDKPLHCSGFFDGDGERRQCHGGQRIRDKAHRSGYTIFRFICNFIDKTLKVAYMPCTKPEW